MIVWGRAALGTNLHDLSTFQHSFAGSTSIFHRFSKRFLYIGIASCFNRFDTVQSMLEIGCGNDHGITHFCVIQFFVVTECFHFLSIFLLEESNTFFSTPFPNVGNSDDFKA